jgi:hypothetical protein
MGKLKVLAQEATNRATANGTFVPVGAPLCEGPIAEEDEAAMTDSSAGVAEEQPPVCYVCGVDNDASWVHDGCNGRICGECFARKVDSHMTNSTSPGLFECPHSECSIELTVAQGMSKIPTFGGLSSLAGLAERLVMQPVCIKPSFHSLLFCCCFAVTMRTLNDFCARGNFLSKSAASLYDHKVKNHQLCIASLQTLCLSKIGNYLPPYEAKDTLSALRQHLKAPIRAHLFDGSRPTEGIT